MRLSVLTLAGLGLVVGCASKPQPPATAQLEPVYEDAQAAALVFDAPVALGEPPIDLDRSGRAEAAYWGIEGPTVTHYYIRTDDRFGTGHWGDWGGDHYRRRSVVVRQGSSIR